MVSTVSSSLSLIHTWLFVLERWVVTVATVIFKVLRAAQISKTITWTNNESKAALSVWLYSSRGKYGTNISSVQMWKHTIYGLKHTTCWYDAEFPASLTEVYTKLGHNYWNLWSKKSILYRSSALTILFHQWNPGPTLEDVSFVLMKWPQLLLLDLRRADPESVITFPADASRRRHVRSSVPFGFIFY